MTVRDEIVAQVASVVPTGIRVEPYARNIDPPKRTTVMVRIDEVVPEANLNGTIFRRYSAALVIVASKSAPGGADDELDAALEDVLHALEQQSERLIVWTSAKRGTYEDSNYPAYEVATTAIIEKPEP